MMIEIVIRDFLNEKLNVPVQFEHYKDEPKRLVVLEKTGSFESNGLGGSLFVFQSYGNSLYEAASLNESLKLAMKGLINLNEIASVKLNTDYNYTDMQTKRYRYQAVYDIKHY